MESVRPAGPNDLPRIAELARTARHEIGPLRGGAVFLAREASEATRLEAALQDPFQATLVGEYDSAVVAYATAHVETIRTGERLGVIDDLFVEAEARGVGIGEALMADLLAWFARHGCVGADAIALPGQRETKNFFEGAGFSARLLVMHHRMDPDGA